MDNNRVAIPRLRTLLGALPVRVAFISSGGVGHFFGRKPGIFGHPRVTVSERMFSYRPPGVRPVIQTVLSSFEGGGHSEIPI